MDTNLVLAAILIAFAAGGLALFLLLARLRHLRSELAALKPQDPAAALLVLQQQLDALREQLRASLEGGSLQVDRRLEETNRVVGDVRRGLGEVDRQVRSVSEVARDLRGLQEMLRSPKVRGGMGESLLAELLAQVLPAASYSLQHEFPGGERVDAALRVGEYLLPVDAKFPLENFRRLREPGEDEPKARRAFRADVRRHIDAIAKRYIRPGDKTFDFAMMYVPAEGVYQEILVQGGDDGLDLLHYALEHRVVPVSPQSFYAYLQVIVLGLRGLSIEGRAQEIMQRLGLIRRRLARFGESFETLTRHLSNAQRQSEEAGRRLGRLESACDDLAGEPVDTEAATALDRPPTA